MAQQHNDWADITSLDTFPKVLQHNAKHWPEQVAMREKEFGIWRGVYLAGLRKPSQVDGIITTRFRHRRARCGWPVR